MSIGAFRQWVEEEHRNRLWGRMRQNFNLNSPPPIKNMAADVISTSIDHREVQAEVHEQPVPQISNDFEVIDDEVTIISPRTFAEANNHSRRSLEVRELLANMEAQNGHSDLETLLPVNYTKRRRFSVNQAVLNLELYMNSELNDETQKKKVHILTEQRQEPPDLSPTFSCPICMDHFCEETSTKCGHIFCKKCIEAALKVKAKCPTCRKKLRKKDTIRIYFPTSS